MRFDISEGKRKRGRVFLVLFLVVLFALIAFSLGKSDIPFPWEDSTLAEQILKEHPELDTVLVQVQCDIIQDLSHYPVAYRETFLEKQHTIWVNVQIAWLRQLEFNYVEGGK